MYTSLAGYGTAGPEQWRPGFDYAAFRARSGLMASLGQPPSPRPLCRGSQGDHTTARNLMVATLAALRLRDRTGHAQCADVTLYGTGIWTLAGDLSAALLAKAQPPRQPFWPRACAALGAPELAAALDRHQLIWAPVATLDEVVADPQARAIGAFVEIEHPKEGRFETLAAPLAIANSRIAPRGPAPELGAHTHDALAEHGFAAEEIAKQRAEGVPG